MAAAGIDVGWTFHVVADPEGRDEQPVREFGVYTEDLYSRYRQMYAGRSGYYFATAMASPA